MELNKDPDKDKTYPLRTYITSGSVGGGALWAIIEMLPPDWAGLAAAIGALATNFLVPVIPKIERYIVRKIQERKAKKELEKQIQILKEKLEQKDLPEEARQKLQDALDMLQNASVDWVVAQSLKASEAIVDITGPISEETKEEAIRLAGLLKETQNQEDKK